MSKPTEIEQCLGVTAEILADIEINGFAKNLQNGSRVFMIAEEMYQLDNHHGSPKVHGIYLLEREHDHSAQDDHDHQTYMRNYKNIYYPEYMRQHQQLNFLKSCSVRAFIEFPGNTDTAPDISAALDTAVCVAEAYLKRNCLLRPHVINTTREPHHQDYQGIDCDELEHGIGYRQPGFLNKIMSKHFFVDEGHHIVLKDFTPDSVRLALQHSRNKWGEQVMDIVAKPDMRKSLEKEAASMGIDVHGSNERTSEAPMPPLRYTKLEKSIEQNQGIER